MVGIAGWFGREPRLREPVEAVMARLKHHRFDETGVYRNPGILLYQCEHAYGGVAGGTRPLMSSDGRYALTMVGELNNRAALRKALQAEGVTLRRDSDAELMLQGFVSWGEDLLDRLQGRFALALHDARESKVLLATDPAAIKALYFSRQPFGIAFASMTRALLPMLRGATGMSAAGVQAYMACEVLPAGFSMLDGVERLEPGHALWLESGAVSRRWRYYPARAVMSSGAEKTDGGECDFQSSGSLLRLDIDVSSRVGLGASRGGEYASALASILGVSGDRLRLFDIGDTPPIDTTDTAGPSPNRPAAGALDADHMMQHLVLHIWQADGPITGRNLPTILNILQAARDSVEVLLLDTGIETLIAREARSPWRHIPSLLYQVRFGEAGDFHRYLGDKMRGASVPFMRKPHAASASWWQPLWRLWQALPAHWSVWEKTRWFELVVMSAGLDVSAIDALGCSYALPIRMPFLEPRLLAHGEEAGDDLARSLAGLGDAVLSPLTGSVLTQAGIGGCVQPNYDVWWRDRRVARLERRLLQHSWLLEALGEKQLVEHVARHRARGDQGALLTKLLQLLVWFRICIEQGGAKPAVATDPLAFIDTE